MEVPMFFRCPISMELMQDPVTVATGVSYDRKNIERWLYCYDKRTCPATMQLLHSFRLTPNHTLKRLILAWQERAARSSPVQHRQCQEMVELLKTIESTPFKVASLRKLRSMVDAAGDAKAQLVACGGAKALTAVLSQISYAADGGDFQMFRACEEALHVLQRLSLHDDDDDDDDGDLIIRLLSEPDCFKAMAAMLQRGSAEARLDAVTILKRMARMQGELGRITNDFDVEILKSLLELISDEMMICSSRASSCALDVLIKVVEMSRKSRLKAIEGGAVAVLVELLPDSSRPKCEKMLFLLKLLCECAEGRLAFSDHPMAVAVTSKKIFGVSELSTKLAVKIFWLVCSSARPTDRMLEDMVVLGAVKKLVGLMHMQGASSTKERAMKIVKMHGKWWAQSPCFRLELDDYFRLVQGSR